MGTYRKYTDDFRAGAVAMLEGAGWPNEIGALERVARHLGLTQPNMLARWAKGESNPPPTKIVEEKRAELSQAIRNEMNEILSAMNTTRDDATYRDLGVVFGIMADKWQLLNDLPTQTIENKISFSRQGPTTLPVHFTQLTTDGDTGETEV